MQPWTITPIYLADVLTCDRRKVFSFWLLMKLVNFGLRYFLWNTPKFNHCCLDMCTNAQMTKHKMVVIPKPRHHKLSRNSKPILFTSCVFFPMRIHRFLFYLRLMFRFFLLMLHSVAVFECRSYNYICFQLCLGKKLSSYCIVFFRRIRFYNSR